MAQTFEKGQAVYTFLHREYGRRGSALKETWESATVIEIGIQKPTYGWKKDGTRMTQEMVRVSISGTEYNDKPIVRVRQVRNRKDEIRSVEDYQEIAQRNEAITAQRAEAQKTRDANEQAEYERLALDIALFLNGNPGDHERLVDFLKREVNPTFARRQRLEREKREELKAAVTTVAERVNA